MFHMQPYLEFDNKNLEKRIINVAFEAFVTFSVILVMKSVFGTDNINQPLACWCQ